MSTDRRRRIVIIVALVVLIPLVILGVWGLTFAGSAGMLPWQPEPTRVVITPFADLPTPGP
jgi:hypothetical protein